MNRNRIYRTAVCVVLVAATAGCAPDPSDVPAASTDPSAPGTSMPAGPTTSVASTTRDELTVVDLSEAPDGDENYPVVEVEANDKRRSPAWGPGQSGGRWRLLRLDGRGEVAVSPGVSDEEAGGCEHGDGRRWRQGVELSHPAVVLRRRQSSGEQN